MGSFEGVAETYEQARRSYPVDLREHLIKIGALSPQSLVVDLGAGTGQMARLVAPVADEVVAVEPDADMLGVGRRVTTAVNNVRWIRGFDADLPRHFARAEIDLVLVGNAFHHMDQRRLLRDLDLLVAPHGLVCIATSGVPVWLQDCDWSLALRSALEVELGPLDSTGVPNADATAALLLDSAFSDVSTWACEKPGTRSCEHVLGEIVSSASGRLSPPALDRLRAVAEPFADRGELDETVQTTALIANRPSYS